MMPRKKFDRLNQQGLSFITVIVFVFIILALILLVFFLVSSNKKTTTTPAIPSYNPGPSSTTTSFTPQILSPVQKSVIGITTETQIATLSAILSKRTLGDGSIQYDLQSALNNRPDNIIAKNGIVTYERVLLPENPSSNGYMKMSDFISRYGQPDQIINGSYYYGFSVSTYIYASKGFAVIGNIHADEAYEVQTFSPISVDQYKNLYGQDLNPGAQPPKEGLTNQEQSLLNFKSHLPYFGDSFSILYNRDTDATTVIIKQANKDTGLKNFNAYLSTFGISDSSQVTNLTIEYK